ncbi:MAG: glycosyltransferase [Candidatus Micrarchaeia archaeon]
MKITQIHNILIKGDGISNTIRVTQKINEALNINNHIAVELFSEYYNVYEFAIYDYFKLNFYEMFKKFMFVENKYKYAKIFIEALKRYKKNVAKTIIENADIRMWHFGSGYELFNFIHFKDIVYYHNITFPHLVTNARAMVESRLQLMSLKDMNPFFITQSNFNKKCLIRMGFEEEDIFVTIPYHKKNFSKIPIKKINKPRLLSYGRYSNNKGIPELAKLCNEADLYLTTFGDNYSVTEYKNNYKKSKKYANGKITIIGKVPEIDTYLNNSDIFVLNSYHEGASLPSVEAEAYGLPLLLKSGTALDELIIEGEKRNGYLFDNVSEIPELVEKIRKDYNKFRYNAWMHSKKYSIDKYQKSYSEALIKYKNWKIKSR